MLDSASKDRAIKEIRKNAFNQMVVKASANEKRKNSIPRGWFTGIHNVTQGDNEDVKKLLSVLKTAHQLCEKRASLKGLRTWWTYDDLEFIFISWMNKKRTWAELQVDDGFLEALRVTMGIQHTTMNMSRIQSVWLDGIGTNEKDISDYIKSNFDVIDMAGFDFNELVQRLMKLKNDPNVSVYATEAIAHKLKKLAAVRKSKENA